MGVYVFHMRGTSFFKIGFTSDLPARMKAVRCSAPTEIALVAWWPKATRKDERAILAHAFDQRLQQGTRGEWFALDETELESVLNLGAKVAGPPRDLARPHQRGHLAGLAGGLRPAPAPSPWDVA